MPHIHTEPGEIDRTACVYIVHAASKRVLLRLHEKYNIWLPPGGHIENCQTAPDAAIAEAKEEVGIDVVLWKGNQLFENEDEKYKELIPPIAMNVHFINPEHRHEDHVYFALSENMDTIEPENHEKSGGHIWLTKAELVAHPDIEERIKNYGLKALELLADWK